MTNEKKYQYIRDLVKTAGSRIFSVQFTKKDGSTRIMTVQQAALAPRCKGEDASDSARQAVETRARNNPHLLNVYSMDAKGIRSVNMDTLDWIQVNGKKHLMGIL